MVDFYCAEVKLAIELDGDSHFLPSAQAYDEERLRFIEAHGVRVIRFLNADVMHNLDGVLLALDAYIDRFVPPPHNNKQAPS